MPEEGKDKGIKADIAVYPTDEVLSQQYVKKEGDSGC